jgi:hypothetical protein
MLGVESAQVGSGRSAPPSRGANEQHRNCDIRQVLRSKLIYFAGKMQRIPKEDQAVHIVDAGSSNLGGDSSAPSICRQ